jgi:hypothetical protein
MTTIKNHLELEKKKLKPSISRIKELEGILKKGSLTLNEWRMTGRFIPIEEYTSINKGVTLINNCREIVEYAGNSIIQVLDTGFFVFEDTKSKILDEVEDKLWITVVEKLWCEKC